MAKSSKRVKVDTTAKPKPKAQKVVPPVVLSSMNDPVTVEDIKSIEPVDVKLIDELSEIAQVVAEEVIKAAEATTKPKRVRKPRAKTTIRELSNAIAKAVDDANKVGHDSPVITHTIVVKPKAKLPWYRRFWRWLTGKAI
jgi:hypothetical protein